jgi:FtsH-binding integral membrane protein
MNENSIAHETQARRITRTWVTPFTLGAFVLSAVTGILLFFKVHIGLIKPTHEWLSWLLVIAAVLHILLNYRPLMKTLSQPLGKALLVVFALLIGASFLPLGDQKEHGRDHGGHSTASGEQHHDRDH